MLEVPACTQATNVQDWENLGKLVVPGGHSVYSSIQIDKITQRLPSIYRAGTRSEPTRACGQGTHPWRGAALAAGGG